MIRTQIQLSEQQARRLRRRASQEGVSLAEIVCRCLDRSLEKESRSRESAYASAARLIGQFPDRKAASDLSRRHDRYLDEAFE